MMPSLAIDSPTLQRFAQTGVDTLTCGGVGGLASVGLSLFRSPALKKAANSTRNMTMASPLDPSILAALPKEPITVTSGNTKFVINFNHPTAITINELAIIPFAILTAVHSK
jgi:hypothetical protein